MLSSMAANISSRSRPHADAYRLPAAQLPLSKAQMYVHRSCRRVSKDDWRHGGIYANAETLLGTSRHLELSKLGTVFGPVCQVTLPHPPGGF
jgi:hypothetical protein